MEKQEVKISALALLKMVMHARSGGNLEIMGLMQGKVDANTLIVMDVFALPVEGNFTFYYVLHSDSELPTSVMAVFGAENCKLPEPESESWRSATPLQVLPRTEPGAGSKSEKNM